MNHPTSWREYHRLRKIGDELDNPALNVFGARFLLVRGLTVSGVDGLSKATAESYAVCLQVGLAYAALETLERALHETRGLEIIDNALASSLRETKSAVMIEAILKTDVVVGKSRTQIESFLASENDNLRYPAYAIRNLMFHGSLTQIS